MIDLPDGPASPLVRGFAACLSTIAQVPTDDLLGLDDLEPLSHALAAWKTWLAGRAFGLVPIDQPRSFQWAGWWIAVADRPGGQVAVLAFGTPPGVVSCPQDLSLLGQATADLPISSAYVVASFDAVVPPLPEAPVLRGTVERVAVAPEAGAPMLLVDTVQAVAGRGLVGDRYERGEGTFSPRAAARPGYQLTLIAAEVVEALTAQDTRLGFLSTRRNVLTRGLDVNALIGRDFTIGDVHCHGHRIAEPCVVLERLEGPGLLRPLVHQGGLRADVLTDGTISPGAEIDCG